MTEDKMNKAMSLLKGVLDYSEFKNVDMVIEVVSELLFLSICHIIYLSLHPVPLCLSVCLSLALSLPFIWLEIKLMDEKGYKTIFRVRSL